MEREIKFRAWYVKGKEMFYEIQSLYDGSCDDKRTRDLIFVDAFCSFLENEDFKVMQSLGIKDTKDKTVYEGDKVKLKDIDGNEMICTVEWHPNECAYNLYQVDGSAYYGCDHMRGLEFEIIGNIYEDANK